MRLSISKTLAIGIISLQIVTVCVILASSFISTEQVLIGHAQQLMRNLSREVIHRSEEFLSPAKSAVSLTKSLARHQVVSAEKPDEMERYFFNQLLLYPHIAGIYYGNLKGDFYFVRRSAEIADFQIKRILQDEGERTVLNRWLGVEHNLVNSSFDPTDTYDPRSRPWFKKAVAERRQIWTDPYLFFTSKTPGITVASPVYSQSGEMLGVVGVDIDLSALSDFLSFLDLSENASAIILNNNGDVVAYRDPQEVYVEDESNGTRRLLRVGELKSPEAKAAVASLNSDPGWYVLNTAKNTSFSLGEREYQAVFTPFSDNWPWLLGIYVPEDDFLTEIKENQRLNLILAVAITLVSVLVGILFARSLSRPILALQKSVDSVKKGELEVNIDPQGSLFRDIDETATAFTNLVKFLKDNESKNEKLKARLTQQTHFMEAVLANIENGVVVCDLEGRFIYSNRVVNKLRGLPEGAHLERFDEAPFKLFKADGLTLLKQVEWPIFLALSGEVINEVEVVIEAASGERNRVMVNGRALFDTAGEQIGAYVLMRPVV